MHKVVSYYYVSDSGRVPARDFIESLAPGSRRKFFYVKELLEEFGRRLPEPHAKSLGEGIFELRFTGQEGAVRALYFFFDSDKAILTNGFIKKTDRTPERELRTAINRRSAYFERYL